VVAPYSGKMRIPELLEKIVIFFKKTAIIIIFKTIPVFAIALRATNNSRICREK
jgi:hypothetical protein